MEEVEFMDQRVENGVVLWIDCFIISQVMWNWQVGSLESLLELSFRFMLGMLDDYNTQDSALYEV